MSNSVGPHRQQPTRLPRPWYSPGKNTGVGCHFLLQCMKVKSENEVAQSCPTLSDPMDCSLPGSSVHGILYTFKKLNKIQMRNIKRYTARHFLIKLLKDTGKEIILKVQQRRELSCAKIPHQLISHHKAWTPEDVGWHIQNADLKRKTC